MGCIYQPRYRDRHGVPQTSTIWWIRYRDAARRMVRESSESTKRTESKRLLQRREGASAEGRPTSPRTEKVTVNELLDDLVAEYTANGRGVDRLGYSLAHLRPVFAMRRAMQVSTADVTAYIVARQEAKAANATINRELAALKRAYSLATQATPPKLHQRPYIPMLKEDNVRTGFFERDQFEAVLPHLPEALRPVARVAYITGWRMDDELFPLRWSQVDFKAGILRLDVGETKNDDGRTFPMIPELRRCLEAQRTATQALQRRQGAVIPWVFHRHGKPIKDLHKTWRTACAQAGCPGRIPHDFRRTAVRNLERAGVPRSAAMKMTGHKTESVYRRYAIVDEVMLHEAAAKLTAFSERTTAQASRLRVAERA
jgi:integrase